MDNEIKDFNGVKIMSFRVLKSNEGEDKLFAMGFNDTFYPCESQCTNSGFWFRGRWFASMQELQDAELPQAERGFFTDHGVELAKFGVYLAQNGQRVEVDPLQ